MQKDQYRLMFEEEDRHFWFLAKRKFFDNLFPDSYRNKTILDLGCGTGGFSKFLEKFGQVTRVEQSEHAIKFLKKRHLRFVKSSIEKYPFLENKFDMVCLIDVLYHKNIKNIDMIIKKTCRTLKKNGYLIIMDSAFPCLKGPHDEKMMGRERFYPDNLSNRLAKHGFTIEKKSYIFFTLFPLTFIMRMLDKILNFNNVSRMPVIINNIFLIICTFEARLFKWFSFPMGSSVIIKARK